ncbi:MAG: hypothetical protein MZV63_08725 [Marinilabiliales bacterium]|nr:hypothetical protein [Marinilabiliales bacterium]
MTPDLGKIFGCFRAEGAFRSGYSFGPGHIHDTYRINTAGDKDVTITSSSGLITMYSKIYPDCRRTWRGSQHHLRQKISAIPGSDVKRECLTLMPAVETGKSFYTDEDGNYWRMFIFISDHRSYERVDSYDKAFEGGRVIGRFQSMLADLPGRASA